MTAQVSDSISMNGMRRMLCSLPLESFLEVNGRRALLGPRKVHTACWRGYLAHWLIEDDKLFLTKISTIDQRNILLDGLFPGLLQPVHAKWYTGELRLPEGELKKYVHGGFASTYERDVFYQVIAGQVMSTRTIQN